MEGFQPERLIFYAGDNDLGDGRHPEEVFIFSRNLPRGCKSGLVYCPAILSS
ncbi:MAG: hypothetical protein ABIP28_06855 [Mucilaginibacter sp.]